MSRTTPDTKFSQKPNHITGKNRFISCTGTPGAAPRIRAASAALIPAARPIPTVWHDRIVGNANTEGDSRTQTLSEVDSSQTRNGSMGRLPADVNGAVAGVDPRVAGLRHHDDLGLGPRVIAADVG